MNFKQQLEAARELKGYLCDWMPVVRNMEAGVDDFEHECYRFIHQDCIDDIMQDELASNEYILGCFNARFLSSILGVDSELIEIIQEAEGYEKLGIFILNQGALEELQEEYVGCDGYGHHFNHYDGSEEHVGEYYMFRV